MNLPADDDLPMWPGVIALPLPTVWLFAAIFLGLPGSGFGPLVVPPVAGMVALLFERGRVVGTALIFGWLLALFLLIVAVAVSYA